MLPTKRSLRLLALLFSVVVVCSALPISAGASSREVLLEDLLVGAVENDIHHRPERPGKIVRVVPWMGEDGSYSVLAISEVGWVYKAEGDPGNWILVGRIFDVGRTRQVAPLYD